MTNKTINICTWAGCEQLQFSRTLCRTHYQAVRRLGTEELATYPTQKFLDNPDDFIRWAFGYYESNVRDIAIEFGFKLEPLN